MRIEIEVSDFYLDEDSGLEEGLKTYVKNEAISTIFAKIKELAEKEIKREIEKHIKDSLASEIANVVRVGTIRKTHDTDPVTIEAYVKDCLFNMVGASWQSFDKIIREVTKTFCDEMRKRYDLTFASNIVANLIDNKLIKDEVVQMALNKKT